MTHYTGEKSKEDFTNLVTVPTQRTIKEMKDIRNKINTCVREDRFIGISFDEWNCWYAWYRTPGVAEGIYAASMLNMFCREALDVGMTIGCYFEPVNEGAVIVDPGGSRLTPVGQAFSLFKTHHGNITINLAPQDPEGLVDAAASIDEDSGDLVVTLVNRNSDESCKVRLSIVGAKKVALSEGFLLRSDDFLPASVFDEAEADTTVRDDDTVVATLPKHSIARLRFSCG
jgi:alpha-L-arabinofuranosidase